MAAKKYKKLTNAEKKLNKKIKKEMVEKGILPPPKPRLNRKKFIDEAKADFEENINTYSDMKYLVSALNYMLPCGYGKISQEEVGIGKILKIAVELKKFEENLIEKGEAKYNVWDMYQNVVAPIKKL